MGEVVGFPNGNSRPWRAYEEGIRAALDQLGYGVDAADWVVEDLKKRPFALQFSDGTLAPARPEELKAARQIKAAYRQAMLRWLVEIIKLEGELWAAKFGKSSGPTLGVIEGGKGDEAAK